MSFNYKNPERRSIKYGALITDSKFVHIEIIFTVVCNQTN